MLTDWDWTETQDFEKLGLIYQEWQNTDIDYSKLIQTRLNLSLEELSEDTCKYMEANPDEKNASFCGRKTVEKFSYCRLHLMIVFQPKGKKDDNVDKDEEMPKFIQKKIKSA